tara:strand:+ start:1504 stop:2274 length:771 start_codon:yes stop_codon:yes gene_type:complete
MSSTKWIFNNKNGFNYLQSILFLNNNINHGFLTKDFQDEAPNTINNLLRLKTKTFSMRQIHSSKIINTSYMDSHRENEGDGLISNKSRESLWIYTADCLPIIVADKKNGFAGTCHAGWRGLSNKIIKNLIDEFIYLGSNIDDIIVAIGPSISAINYEVKPDLINSIAINIGFISKDNSDQNRLLKEMNKAKLILISKDKLNLDLKMLAFKYLISLGIKTSQICISDICTYNNPDKFNSWRRDKSKKRQWSFISSRV